jgi:hypothetical protein
MLNYISTPQYAFMYPFFLRIMALQRFVGSRPLFQFLDPIHSR